MADDVELNTEHADTVVVLEPPRFEGLNIHQRLNRARGETKKIEKTPKKDGMKYDFIAHDDVTAHVKPIFLRWGISPWHTVIEQNQDGNRIELTVESTFFCEDKPDDKVTMRTVGYGIDNQDKGPGKAWTYAVKGSYLKAMMLNSADDVESADVDHNPTLERQADLTEAQAQAILERKQWAEAYALAIGTAKNLDDLEHVITEHAAVLRTRPDDVRDYFRQRAAEAQAKLQT